MPRRRRGKCNTVVHPLINPFHLFIIRIIFRRYKQFTATQAIIHRLKFLRLFLQALTALSPGKSISPTEQEMNEITRLLTNAVDLVPLIKRSISLGTQPEPNADAPNPVGFSPSVNQRILPPTFPRYTKIKARDVSITFLEELVQRTKQACKIIHCTNYHSALVSTNKNCVVYTRNKNDSNNFHLLFIEFFHRIQ